MTINLPRNLRAALYILLMIGSPIIAFGQAKWPEYVDANVITLWLSLSAVIALIAGLNLTPPNSPKPDK